jgi:hypothetical protein
MHILCVIAAVLLHIAYIAYIVTLSERELVTSNENH